MTPDLRRRYQFFHEHAGYIVGQHAKSALHLARAERWLETQPDLFVVEEPDFERAYCYYDDPKCQYHEGSTHEWDTACVRIVRICAQCLRNGDANGETCRHSDTIASLSGIIEPDAAYLRVVRAELASEIYHDEKREQGA